MCSGRAQSLSKKSCSKLGSITNCCSGRPNLREWWKSKLQSYAKILETLEQFCTVLKLSQNLIIKLNVGFVLMQPLFLQETILNRRGGNSSNILLCSFKINVNLILMTAFSHECLNHFVQGCSSKSVFLFGGTSQINLRADVSFFDLYQYFLPPTQCGNRRRQHAGYSQIYIADNSDNAEEIIRKGFDWKAVL